ncbi:helix-turn-helix domain-containing protein [Nitratireductor sp. XY-223]|uniref:helix-turn-helix domain-containing protein n=1 Tax=Nitratireductor sp. XY-223 TaxID=2561926 RepID=UPI0010AA9697|nr:helix-turn-helix domain-containing protein [Nitratireductor sp. XY-223]
MMCYEEWNAALRACCGHYYSVPTRRQKTSNGFDVLDIHGMDVASIRCTIDRISRTNQGIRRDDAEHLFLLYQVAGQTHVIHNSRETTMEPGDFLLLDSVRPAELLFDGGMSDFRSIHMPRSLFLAGRSHVPCVGSNLSRRHPLHSSLANILFSKDQEDEAGAADYLFDYVSMVFGPDQQSSQASGFRNRHGRMRFIRETIDLNLKRKGFCIDMLASLVGLSRRQLQRELTASGTTYSRLLQQRRLRHLIASKTRGDRLGHRVSLAELVLSSGFNDQSHFNRVFRQHYGVAPREYFEINRVNRPAYLN